jgi:hypothetical protein
MHAWHVGAEAGESWQEGVTQQHPGLQRTRKGWLQRRVPSPLPCPALPCTSRCLQDACLACRYGGR